MRVQGVLLDLSGTIYMENELIQGTREALETLHEKAIPVRYLTNSSRSTRRQVRDRLAALGLSIDEELILTAPRALRLYLEQRGLRPWLLVHPELECEFADLDQSDPNAVVVGDAGAAFTYVRLNHAFRLLLEGAALLAVGDNRYFRESGELSLDAGPFVKALEFASGTEALILGKPSTNFFLSAVKSLSCSPHEVLMIGDDLESDVNGALHCGLQAALVQTGKYRQGDEKNIAEGGWFAANLSEAVERILN